jgi:TRAP-type C4-dicarboxylate transport system permease large subunit
LPGGLAVVCVLASAGFTVFSGASGITIVAIGGLLFPALVKDGYPEKFSLGLVTSGGALGITFFPCLPLLVYGIIAGLQEMPPGMDRVELDKMIYAGIMPGLLIIVLMIAYSMVMGVISKVPKSKFNASEALSAMWEAKWELALPIVVLLGLKYGGGAMGAASLTAAYVFIVEVFVYRDLSLTKDIPRIIPDSMVLVGAIFVKLCAATVLTFYFVQAQTADVLFEALTCGEPAREYLAAHSDVLVDCREAVNALAARGESAGGLIDSPITFLIALNFFLLIVGMLMDIFSAIVVIVPLIMGIAIHFNIDPYHLGIVFLINLEIGYLMPPMGLNLFIASFRFGRPVPDLYPVVLPFIGVFVTALLVTTYVPALTLSFIPGYTPHVAEHAAPIDETTPEPGTDPSTDTGDEAPAGDCDVPGEGEDFAAFEARCSGAEAGGEATPPSNANCDVPGDNESFEDFEARCNGGEAAPTEAPTEAPVEGAAVEGGIPDEAAPDTRGPGCDVPRADESFDQFEARCGA